METVNIHDAKTRLSAILAEVEKKGKTFVICRNGKPLAELGPMRRAGRLKKHPVMSRIKVAYDPVEDLSDDEWGDID